MKAYNAAEFDGMMINPTEKCRKRLPEYIITFRMKFKTYGIVDKIIVKVFERMRKIANTIDCIQLRMQCLSLFINRKEIVYLMENKVNEFQTLYQLTSG